MRAKLHHRSASLRVSLAAAHANEIACLGRATLSCRLHGICCARPRQTSLAYVPGTKGSAAHLAGDLSSAKEEKYTLDYYMAMAEAIVDHGAHAIGIKDMAGLLKPRAATTLISALREKYPDTVLFLPRSS